MVDTLDSKESCSLHIGIGQKALSYRLFEESAGKSLSGNSSKMADLGRNFHSKTENQVRDCPKIGRKRGSKDKIRMAYPRFTSLRYQQGENASTQSVVET